MYHCIPLTTNLLHSDLYFNSSLCFIPISFSYIQFTILFNMTDQPFLFYNVTHSVSDNLRSLSFFVAGKPPAQQRTRVNFKRNKSNTSFPVFYDPSRNSKRQWTQALKKILDDSNINIPVFPSDPYVDQPIQLEVNIYLSIPKTDINTKKQLKNKHHLWPNTKDIDNMIKYIMDAMQQIIYTNDAVICSIKCTKQFVTATAVTPTHEVPITQLQPYTTITLKQNII